MICQQRKRPHEGRVLQPKEMHRSQRDHSNMGKSVFSWNHNGVICQMEIVNCSQPSVYSGFVSMETKNIPTMDWKYLGKKFQTVLKSKTWVCWWFSVLEDEHRLYVKTMPFYIWTWASLDFCTYREWGIQEPISHSYTRITAFLLCLLQIGLSKIQ